MKISSEGRSSRPECLWFNGDYRSYLSGIALGPGDDDLAVLETCWGDAVVVSHGEVFERYELEYGSCWPLYCILGCHNDSNYFFLYPTWGRSDTKLFYIAAEAPIDSTQSGVSAFSTIEELPPLNADWIHWDIVDEMCHPDMLAALVSTDVQQYTLVTYLPGSQRIDQKRIDLPPGSRPLRLLRYQDSLWVLLEHEGRLLILDLLPPPGQCGRQLDLGPEIAEAAVDLDFTRPELAVLGQTITIALHQGCRQGVRHFLVQPGAAVRELPPLIGTDLEHLVGTPSATGPSIEWMFHEHTGNRRFVMRRFSCPRASQ
ncbi:MAG: hypothetical protein FJ125_00975 [Deltaproteobacteria bacterium]|nr:hypothetical protein [Deltaproteobacteria bacterium]